MVFGFDEFNQVGGNMKHTKLCSTEIPCEFRTTHDPLSAQKKILDLKGHKMKYDQNHCYVCSYIIKETHSCIYTCHGWWWERGSVAKGGKRTCLQGDHCFWFAGFTEEKFCLVCAIPLSPSHSQLAFPSPSSPLFLHGHGAVGCLRLGWWRKRRLRRGQG